jgi:hypothetical protein
MDDLIRAAPDSALDADNFDMAVDLTVDDVEEVPSPPDVPKHLGSVCAIHLPVLTQPPNG